MSFLYKIKQYGYLNSFKRLVKSILRKIGVEHEVYLYCKKSINLNDIDTLVPKIEGTVKELTNRLINDFSLIELSTEKIELFQKRLEDKYFKGYGFFHKGYLVYYTWFSLKDFEMSLSDENLLLDIEEGLLFDSYCHPEYRKFGIHQFMNSYRLKKLAEHGKKKVVVVVLNENIPARKTQKKSGFICDEIIIRKKLFNIYKSTRIINKQVKL